jgi:putative ABC transport system permease protein
MIAAHAKIAWRNVRRNRRRTALTVIAVAFGVLLIIVMGGKRNGQYAMMIDTSVRRSVGHVQIHRAGYWDDRSLKKAFEVHRSDTAAISSVPGVEGFTVRLETDALVGTGGENATGARIIGLLNVLDADGAEHVGSPRSAMIEGVFFADDDTSGAVIGRTMARNLGVSVGDELVLLTQARDGSIAAALLVLRGVFRVGEPEMDGYTLFCHLAKLQEALVSPGRATSIALIVDDHRRAGAVAEELSSQLAASLAPGAPEWEVMTYEELDPELMQTIAFDWAVDMILQLLLLTVVTFGILNTILMSVTERFHEFGVLMAIGMPTRAIGAVVFFEGILISTVGLVVGNVIGYAFNDWWQDHPLIISGQVAAIEDYGFVPMLFAVPDMVQQLVWSAVVLILTLIVAMWPAAVAMRYKPIDAIRHV